MNTKDKIFLAIGSVAIISAVGVGGYVFVVKPTLDKNNTEQVTSGDSSQTKSNDSSSNSSNPDSNNSSSQSATSSYKDGQYIASASYSVPHGYENTIKVTVTIASGKITSASATHDYNDRESGEYIDAFDSALSSKVVGQSIDSTDFSRIGGASLTTVGFDQALEAIQADAKS